jgi:uncharacterized cofD-like protein
MHAPHDATSPAIVALGGGTGLPLILSGLKLAGLPRERLTAIVTVADDGGSSGRLRREDGSPPPGDVRNCLVALAQADPAIVELFRYRFEGAGTLGGHSLGNIILAAYTIAEHDLAGAAERAAALLDARGRVFPATVEDVTLVAETADGRIVLGESAVASAGSPIRRVRLAPATARALPEAVQAIAEADLIVLSPGSLFTSLLPVLVVPGIAAAVTASRARVALVANLMTEPGETDGFRVSDLARAVLAHAPGLRIHDVLVNVAPLARNVTAHYARVDAEPIPVDADAIEALGPRVIAKRLLASGLGVRHDPRKLARELLRLARQARRETRVRAAQPVAEAL